MSNDQEKRFLEKYDIRILNEKRGYRIGGYNRYFTDPKDANIVQDYRREFYSEYLSDQYVDRFIPNYERVMVVEIPERSLERLLEMEKIFYARMSEGHQRVAETIVEKEYKAERLRKQNPAVQAAWEQYSLMLHLASNGEDLT